jgi:tRNA(Ile)-lysidine synthase
MLNTVETYMLEHNMITKGDRIVMGVSGGADSVCLFHVMLSFTKKYNLTLFVVHVNHMIRGMEADDDENYVQQLCEENGVSFTLVKADVRTMAKMEGLSEEEAGRIVRYQAFYECLEKNKCNKIAIAHNKNDNAETVLFHMFRGSGIKGLTGISEMRDNIIRPLLSVTRADIETYLKENKLVYHDDHTNFTLDYSRNKIRHNIIKFAQEEINSKVIEHIVSAANQLKEINDYLEDNIKIAYKKHVIYNAKLNTCVILTKNLKKEHVVIQKGMIRSMIKQLVHQLKDVDALHINLVLTLMEKEVGKSLDLPYGIIAVKGYEDITLKLVSDYRNKIPISNTNELIGRIEEIEIIGPGEYCIPKLNILLSIKLFNYKKNMIIPKNGCTKWFDYDKIKNTVLIRTRKEGDFLQIDSIGSKKKLKSLFIDEKVPREKRDFIPLLTDGSHVMWVIGGRMSEAYKISQDTKMILEISLDGGKQDDRR